MLARFERLAPLKTRMNTTKHEVTIDGAGAPRIFSPQRQTGRKAFARFLADFQAVPLRGKAEVAFSASRQFGEEINPLRFRANFYFDGAEAWSELNWVGRRLRCGDIVLNIVQRTRRCSATSVRPLTGERDLNLPVITRDYRDHGVCGVYAEVGGSGRLDLGGALELLDAA